MIDFFRDQLSAVTNTGAILGCYDNYNKNYVVSIQPTGRYDYGLYKTLSFDERSKGWTSFFDFKPQDMFSSQGQFYSTKLRSGEDSNELYQHYTNQTRNSYYGTTTPSSIQFLFNPAPNNIKTFQTINYEGSNGWEVISYVSDITGVDSIEVDSFGQPVWLLPPETRDTTNSILSYYEGEYIINPLQASPTFGTPVYRPDYVTVFGNDDPPYNKEYAGFVRKENKYYANLVNNSSATAGEVRFGEEMTGIKAYYCTVTIENDDYTNIGGAKELFAVNSTFVQSS